MVRILILFMIMNLIGCATNDWNSFMYGNPTGQTYGMLCEQCGRESNFTQEQISSYPEFTCPYCGHKQNTQMALNRYTYAVQRQQSHQDAQLGTEFIQKVNDINQQTYQSQQAVLNRPTPQLAPKSTTCRPDGLGGIKCTDSWNGF